MTSSPTGSRTKSCVICWGAIFGTGIGALFGGFWGASHLLGGGFLGILVGIPLGTVAGAAVLSLAFGFWASSGANRIDNHEPED